MEEMREMKYPIGVQNFERLRNSGAIYVDKTRLIWDLVNQPAPIFLSRPRRFGKSLLMSTIEAYFQGKKALFEGLFISDKETAWTSYPIIHLDLSAKDYVTVSDLHRKLRDEITKVELQYGFDSEISKDADTRFGELIVKLNEKFKIGVVILVDEYDNPILKTVENARLREEFRNVLKAFYGKIKSLDGYIRFAMLTGITRFSKVSIFSDLNNLLDITLNPRFNDICGISESELTRYFTSSIESLAKAYDMNFEDTKERIKRNYDGYHFADPENTDGIYNPFSLLNCFYMKQILDFWSYTGTPTFLVDMLARDCYSLQDLNHETQSVDDLIGVFSDFDDPIPILYQAGYLTLKKFYRETNDYDLGFPNREVENSFNALCFRTYGKRNVTEFDISKFVKDLERGDAEMFVKRLEKMLADVPYKQSCDSEMVYHNLIYLLCKMLGAKARAEYQMNWGASDLIVKTRKFIYVMEFKFNGSARRGIEQIQSKGYAKPFEADGREIIRLAINFSPETRNIKDWEMR